MKFIPHRLLLCVLITICLLSHKSSSADPKYEACAPKLCGKQTIKFPFYIQEEQESYCGYPGFNLTCKNNEYPILDITGDEYRVDKIFYTNHSIHVSNAHLWSSNSSTCYLSQIRNLTLEGDRFQLSSSNKLNLVLLSDCSSSRLKEGLLRYRVDCNQDEKEDYWVLAMYLNDTNLNSAIEACDAEVVAPVDQSSNGSSSNGDSVELLKRGFLLNWTASNCSPCEASGGLCGFDAERYHFKCYCRDRPHFASCPRMAKKRSLRLILTTGIPAGCVVIITAVLLCCFWSKCSANSIMLLKDNRKHHEKVEAFIKKYGSLAPKRYRYLEIKKMANSFKYKLGQGGYGGVYKGKLPDGRDVAVKILNTLKGDGEEFLNEVASISRTSHVNIVALLGFCFAKKALIYEFMPNGSVGFWVSEWGAHEGSDPFGLLVNDID